MICTKDQFEVKIKINTLITFAIYKHLVFPCSLHLYFAFILTNVVLRRILIIVLQVKQSVNTLLLITLFISLPDSLYHHLVVYSLTPSFINRSNQISIPFLDFGLFGYYNVRSWHCNISLSQIVQIGNNLNRWGLSCLGIYLWSLIGIRCLCDWIFCGSLLLQTLVVKVTSESDELVSCFLKASLLGVLDVEIPQNRLNPIMVG